MEQTYEKYFWDILRRKSLNRSKMRSNLYIWLNLTTTKFHVIQFDKKIKERKMNFPRIFLLIFFSIADQITNHTI